MTKQLPLRPNVCLLIFNRDKKLFLGERKGLPGVWQFPQGGVELEFSLEENALREAAEELGVDQSSLNVLAKLQARHEYDFDVVPEYARGVWRGQTQTFWLLEFTGPDSEINLNRYEPELMDWKWCTVAEVRELAEPKRLKGYQAALKEYEEWKH